MFAFTEFIDQCFFVKNTPISKIEDCRSFIYRSLQVIEKNYHKSCFGFNDFAKEMNVSKSTLNRKILYITGMTPLGLIRFLRIRFSMVLLRDDKYYISEIAFMVGFNDPKYFCRCFKDQIGTTPKEYRLSLSKELVEIIVKTKDEPDQFLNKTINAIERRISDSSFSARILALDLNVSKATLYRKLKLYSGLAPCEFINNVRINRSVKLLMNSGKQICDVAYESGFNNPKYFSRRFKERFGVNPSKYEFQFTN